MQKTDLNITPYYDDFSEDKNFQKVLYRAGRPLQARELTQTQSILQNQIERFGNHFFKEGSIIQGAQTDVSMDYYYVKVSSANPNSLGDSNVETYRTSSHLSFIRGKTSGVIAQIFASSAETSDDPLTLFVKYYSQGTDSTNSTSFVANEELEFVTLDSNGSATATSSNNEFSVLASTETPNGRASIANISEGVVFLRGFFCKVEAQQLILEKYSGKPSYRVGLKITEQIITSANDSSLLDNATGTNNENAAGADRLKLSLILSKYLLTDTDDVNFVEFVRVNNGTIELSIQNPIYNEIENTLARRTFDANGDFVVRQFTHSLREHLDDTINRGYYTSTNGGDETKVVMQVSPGKAYVKGYEIEKIGTTPITLNKARTTVSLDNANTPIRLGNFLRVTNAHSLPEFGNETGTDAQSPFQYCKLWPSVISSAGTENSEDHIGFARVRDITLNTGTDTSNVYDNSSKWELSMFDIKMFTKISYSGHSGTAQVGDKITGSSSGATGILAYDNNSNAIYLHDVVGNFTTSDALSSEGAGNFSITSGQNTAVRDYNIDRVRSITQNPKETSRETFTADLVVDAEFSLAGTITFTNASATVTGFGTRFAAQIKEGDKIYNPGNSEYLIVSSVTSDTSLTLTGNAGGGYQGKSTRFRTQLYNQDQTANIFAWPRDFVKSHTAESVTIRRQQVLTVDGSGTFTLSTGSNGTFGSVNTDNFTLAVIEQKSSGTPDYSNGDLLNIEDFTISGPTSSGTGQTLTVQGLTNDDGAIIKATFTVTVTDPVNRSKTLRQGRLLKVGSSRTAGGFYGTAYNDSEISLGVSDIHKIRAVYMGTTPLPPSATLNSISGTFTLYETVVGQTSGARATLIDYNGSSATSYWYYTNAEKFVDGETIVGQTSSAFCTISGVSQGSQNIVSRYFFDDGQRDGYYDLGKLIRKPGNPAPNEPILIVFDYFTSTGSGDFYDINSYGSIDYDDIPVYSPNKVDLGGLEPDGTFELSDCVDFRPNVGQILGTTTFSSDTPDVSSPIDLSNSTSGAVYSPFSYVDGRSFLSSRSGITATGANAVDTPVNQSSVIGDIDFYVSRIDKVYLHKSGKFQIATGDPALTPTKPKSVDDCIELFEVTIPAYTKSLNDIKVRSKDHRRFTMSDIGKINNRVTNLERITSLSLLEKDVQGKQILDADGFDRFKSGFLVDNFRGHKVGDVFHPDYNCSIDGKKGHLRPKSFQQFFDVSLDTSTSSNYTKTGDLITLPYTQYSWINQSKASRSINVNPYNVYAFVGSVKLTPATDIWQDTERLPDVRINREGTFDAMKAKNDIGTVWNDWQTTWIGEPTVTSTETVSQENGYWEGDPTQGGQWVAGSETRREITETPENQTRTGIITSVVEDFVETRNDRTVSVSIVPFMRARTIEIDAKGLKPSTNHYFFFDGIRVDAYVRPYSATYSQDGGVTVSSGVKTDGNGRLRAYFELPNNTSQSFPTGSRKLQITSSYYDLPAPASHGSAIYQAQGLLQSNQTEITSTRNGRVIFEAISDSRQIIKTGEQLNQYAWDTNAPAVDQNPPNNGGVDDPIDPPDVDDPNPRDRGSDQETPPFRRGRGIDIDGGYMDPLAQSFMVDAATGIMLTSIDVYFRTKSDSLPVTVEIRNMVNGYPGQIILPFSQTTLTPAEVNVSEDGATATTFTFESPVFLEEGKEYCFVVLSNSNDYEAFISRMGETDLKTGQTISGQPYAGSLFLSQNASTWTAEQTDDLKFNLKAAKFDTSKTSNLVFENDALSSSRLQENPIQTFSGQTYVKVFNYSHGMYSTSSNVILTQVEGDKEGVILNISHTSSGTLPVAGTYSSQSTTDTVGTGTGCTVEIVISGTAGNEVIDSVKIENGGSGYTTSSSLTITNLGGETNTITIDVDTVGNTLGGIPVDAINATYTAIANIGMDSFTVIPDLSSYDFVSGYSASSSTIGGGRNVRSTRNYYFDVIHTIIPNILFADTRIFSSIYGTYMDTPEGTNFGTVYNRQTSLTKITLNDNSFLGSPRIVASPINETNEMSSKKSFKIDLQLKSFNANVSPIIDVATIGCLGIMNRLNNIDSSSDVPTGTTYIASTEPDGDNNAFVYCTKKVNLKTPATAIRVAADIFRPSGNEVKLLYKVLKNDDNTPWDDIGWNYFNSDGSADVSIPADGKNFKEYEFTAEDLAEFSAFAVKIVGQGNNTSRVPVISALRCIALAT